MKLVLCMFLFNMAFAGVGDSAGGSSKSWSELLRKKDSTYYFEMPSYKFDNGMTLSIYNLCDEGNSVRSIRKYDIVKTIHRKERSEYVKIGSEYARRLINDGIDNKIVELESEIEIRKVKLSGNNRNGFSYTPGQFLFTKKYVVQKCEVQNE